MVVSKAPTFKLPENLDLPLHELSSRSSQVREDAGMQITKYGKFSYSYDQVSILEHKL
jgi:hypothetical protein